MAEFSVEQVIEAFRAEEIELIEFTVEGPTPPWLERHTPLRLFMARGELNLNVTVASGLRPGQGFYRRTSGSLEDDTPIHRENVFVFLSFAEEATEASVARVEAALARLEDA